MNTVSSEIVMADYIAKWHREHINFSKLLDLLETQVSLFHEDEHPNYELMLDIMYYLTHYADQVHHPEEEVAFKRVAQKDSRMQPVVTDLTKQHQLIAGNGKTLTEQLDAIVIDSMVTRQSMESSARTYILHLRNHMNLEETALFPTASNVLRVEDWAAVDAAIKSRQDPLFGQIVDKRYEALHQQIAREAECGCKE